MRFEVKFEYGFHHIIDTEDDDRSIAQSAKKEDADHIAFLMNKAINENS